MLPSTSKEQRGPIYEDLAPLIVPGFLTSRVRFGKTTLGLRSLSSNDLNLLRMAAEEGGPEWPFQIAAASIWMVDGIPLLESYPYSTKVALDVLKSAHKSVVRAVFCQCLSFFSRMKAANQVFESYLYEEESRRLWKSTNNGNFPVWSQAGIPGVERLGLNPFQSAWVQWNRSEDDRLNDDYSWVLTKTLVSVQSPKGAKKLDGKDKTRHESERTRRSEVQDRAFYLHIGVLNENGDSAVHPSLLVSQPRSASELAEEMRRWVAGEQDFHDKVVSDYKERVRVQYEQAEIESAESLERARERREQEEKTLGAPIPSLVGLTQDQVSSLLQKKGKPGARFIVESNPISKVFNRYLRDAPDPGALQAKDGKLVVYSEPSVAPPVEVEKRPSLNDLIARRKPTY